MFDGPGLHRTLQRARGTACVVLGPGGLERLAQAGSAKAMLPRVHGSAPEVVFLNTAGGLTGGDRMAFGLALGAGAGAVGTTQTAERVYRSCGGAA
ncbi:MAG: urease accessory protein UreD, partial [Rhodobacteraceae bacterium]|nr:urease accessory protein UreD [Paracoccaceae bacterium]